MSDSLDPREMIVHNQSALEELAWAIESSEGQFTLILARCNYRHLRDRLVTRLQEICTVPLKIIHLPADTRALYATLREALDRDATLTPGEPFGVLVFGLDAVTNLDQLLSTTNQVREEFRRNCPFPVVLWVTDDVYRTLARHASDFESWATTTHFALPGSHLLESLQRGGETLFDRLLQSDPEDSFTQLAFVEEFGDLQRSELTAALTDLEAQGITPTPDLQASLDFARALDAGDSPQAQAWYERSLRYWQPIAPLKAALLSFTLGRYHYWLADRIKYRTTPDWTPAKEAFEQALALFERENAPNLSARCITQMERVLRRMEAWDDLAAIARKGIDLHHAYHSPKRAAQDYGFLAEVALERQDWETARQSAQQALDTLTTAQEERFWEAALYLLFLARAERGRGNQEAALTHLNRAIDLGDHGHPQIYSRLLEEKRQLRREQRQYLEAFDLKQERFSVEQRYGIRAFIGAGRLRSQLKEVSQTWENRSTAPEENVAPEITASGRQKDLSRILERIGRNDYKLIIVHGGSGVGKSSLINAGVVPALKQKAIGVQNNLPIIVRNYNQWAEELEQCLRDEIGTQGDAGEGREGGEDTTANPNPSPISIENSPTSLQDSSTSIENSLTNTEDSTPSSSDSSLRPHPSSFSSDSSLIPHPSSLPSPSSLIPHPSSLPSSSDSSLRPHPSSLPSPSSLLPLLRSLEPRSLRPILIFDQFEEFFFVYPRPEDRRPFFEFLCECLQILPLKLVLALREDYLHLLLELGRLPTIKTLGIDILSQNVLYELGNFTPNDTRAIIQSLTDRSRFYLEPALIDQLVTDLAKDLGEVRPIEMQVVGAQLQADKINTLAQYRALGDKPKEQLVERYLAEVVNDCGDEHRQLAELVLYLLTDEKGTRPLKTQLELEKELESLGIGDPHPPAPSPEGEGEPNTPLPLILTIFVKSGLVFQLRESPNDRYQLVHDYLAAFIRQKEGSRLDMVLAELREERRQRQQAEAALMQAEKAQQVLATANQKAKQRIRIGSAILAITILAAGAIGFLSRLSVGEAINKQQEATQKADLAAREVQEATRDAADKTKQADQSVREAQTSVRAAQTRLTTANLRVKQADQALAQAKQELAGIDRQAKARIQAATLKVKEAEAKATEARQQQAKAQQAVAAAQQEIALKKLEFEKLNTDFVQAKKQINEAQNQISLAQQAIAESIGDVPATIAQQTGVKPAIIYISFIRSGQEASAEDALGLLMVTEKGQFRQVLPQATRQEVLQDTRKFIGAVSDPRRVRTKSYLEPAQVLYQRIILPLETELKNQRISNLTFIIEDPSLRRIPLAALHDGQQFLVEKYSTGIMPGLSLIGNRPSNLRNASVLALGVSESEEFPLLPGVLKEIGIIAELWRNTTILLNKNATLKNLQTQRRQNAAQIIHLATYAEVVPDNYSNSFIQLWGSKIGLKDIEEFGLDNPPLELLVLSANRSTVGNDAYRFGFATAAIQAGAKSILGSLYYVSDQGTMALMAEFYAQLKTAPIKAEALRQAQIAMLRGEIRIEEGQLLGVTGLGRTSLPPELVGNTSEKFSHPYFWAGFTIIGNPW